MTPLADHGRFGYSPIAERLSYRWPNGARVALYIALGLEAYSFDDGLTEDLVPGVPKPDILNASWREYGNRVGAWRVLDCLAEHAAPCGILLNTAIYDHAPALTDACRDAGHEIIAHGHSNSHTLAGRDEADEAAYIAAVTNRIAQAEGSSPRGWASPWIAETPRTPDLLREAGYEYLLDWCMDDQPVWMRTRSGPILSVPYSQELNDSSAVIGRMVGPSEFSDMVVDQFDEMTGAAHDQPLVMSVILHSFIIGQPFRLRAFRRALTHMLARRRDIWLTTPGAIATHAAAVQQTPDATQPTG
jgi:peptidoglycan/xylan/chitin deacetylase (PgdA/CDA1 family)